MKTFSMLMFNTLIACVVAVVFQQYKSNETNAGLTENSLHAVTEIAPASPLTGLSDTSVAQITSVGCLPNNGTGTGWVIGNNVIATAAHVIHGAETITVGFGTHGDEGVGTARVVGYNQDRDIAILNITTNGRVAPDLSFDSPTSHTYNSIGHPRSRPLEVSPMTGHKISADSENRRGKVYVMSGEVEPGDSGSPMFNLEGKVTGMIYGTSRTYNNGEAVSDMKSPKVYVTPSEYVWEELQKAEKNNWHTVQHGSCNDTFSLGIIQ